MQVVNRKLETIPPLQKACVSKLPLLYHDELTASLKSYFQPHTRTGCCSPSFFQLLNAPSESHKEGCYTFLFLQVQPSVSLFFILAFLFAECSKKQYKLFGLVLLVHLCSATHQCDFFFFKASKCLKNRKANWRFPFPYKSCNWFPKLSPLIYLISHFTEPFPCLWWFLLPVHFLGLPPFEIYFWIGQTLFTTNEWYMLYSNIFIFLFYSLFLPK